MEFHLFKRHSKYSQAYEQLIAQHRLWQKLSMQIKQKLPSNLSPYYRVACLTEGVLVIFAENSMVASRLKMLAPALLDHWTEKPKEIRTILVKLSPRNTLTIGENTLKLDDTARAIFARTAKHLVHHPVLASVLNDLAQYKG